MGDSLALFPVKSLNPALGNGVASINQNKVWRRNCISSPKDRRYCQRKKGFTNQFPKGSMHMAMESRRSFNQKMLGSLLTYGLIETLYSHDLFAAAVKPVIHKW